MKRVLLLAVACLLCCTACRPRVDLTPPEEPDSTTTAAVPTLPTQPGEQGSQSVRLQGAQVCSAFPSDFNYETN